MNNEEAKFLLQAYRPNGRDAADPAMAPALAQAKNDPTLGAWFAREQAHAHAIAAKLDAIAPPAGLREAILAGAKASGRATAPARVRTRWRQPGWLAMAAAVVLLLGAGVWWRFAPVTGATLEDFAANYVARGFVLQKHSADVSELQSWLAQQHGPRPLTLPAKLTALRALGCRTIDFSGREISLVCFERDGKEFHMFVAARDVPDDAPEPAPRFGQHGRFASASWSDAKNHYVLVSDAGLDAVRQLL